MGAKPEVAVVMGSDSDWPVMSETIKLLAEFGVGCGAEVISAHRTPERAQQWAASAEKRGFKVVIAAAGGAAHLAGVLAASTTLPVIGVPMVGWALDGLDALLATVQMPGGVPVASLGTGKGGPVNAALFAARILALGNPALAGRLAAFRAAHVEQVAAKDRKLQEKIGG